MSSQKIITFLLVGLLFPLTSVLAETIQSPHQFAWSNSVGYVNLFGVTVSDSALGGYAWSTNAGFINFSPALGGVKNDGKGDLSGSAWGEQLGWIDFDGVSIDGNTGKFSGTATGTLIGTLTFDCPNFCDVETDWRQAEPASGTDAGGGGGGSQGQNGGGGGNGTGANQGAGISVPASNPVLGNEVGAATEETPALFDIALEPLQSSAGRNAWLVISSIIFGTALLTIAFFAAKKVREDRATKVRIAK